MKAPTHKMSSDQRNAIILFANEEDERALSLPTLSLLAWNRAVRMTRAGWPQEDIVGELRDQGVPQYEINEFLFLIQKARKTFRGLKFGVIPDNI